MKKLIKIFLLLTFIFTLPLLQQAQNPIPPKKVACVGNSITYGSGIEDREHNSYPAILGKLLGEDY